MKNRGGMIEDEEDEDEYEDEEDEDDEEDEEQGQEIEAGVRKAIYDVDGLHETLEDIGWTTEAPWDETQVITGKDEAQVDDVDDDLARELSFYNQALSAAQEAIGKFEAAGLSWARPVDYYAEMVKTDQHMAKVKEQLMFEQRQIELAEERRKQREQKQYSKQVQAERLKEKAQDKKRQIDSISKLRKQREKEGFKGEHDYDAELKNLEPKRRQAGNKFQDRRQEGSNAPVNKKRQQKNQKYGFGGPKRMSKQNDAVSAASMDGYRAPGKKGSGGNNKRGGLKAKGGVKKPQQKQRPGKSKRQAQGGKGR